MKFQAVINFKEIKTNTYEKERERKLKDQEKWTACFDRIVGSYFESKTFKRFHNEFNPLNDRLDCFVPSRGHFKCQQFSNPGSKETTKKLDVEEGATKEVFVEDDERKKGEVTKIDEEEKKEAKKKKKKVKITYPKNGCGKNWNSNLCLTKFVCSIEEGNKLVVMLREYGQICKHCTRRYENPSFNPDVLTIMMTWLLSMILEGKRLFSSWHV